MLTKIQPEEQMRLQNALILEPSLDTASQKYSISVCIPTCNRVRLLEEAILSCLSQTLPPAEVVIGDDSTTQATEELLARLRSHTEIPIRYTWNSPRLGQNANVNSIFLRASGTHLVLLHDDDILTPNALQDLISCWNLHPDLTAAYGKQYVISHDGKRNLKASEALNRTYHRTHLQTGLQKESWRVGLSQQFPNNGYMVTAVAAKALLWRSAEDVGYGGEFDFGLRLGLQFQEFYFLDQYTSAYRLTQGTSISGSTTDDAALQSYRITRDVHLPPEAELYRSFRLSEFAPRAVMQAIRLGRKKEAWAIFFSVDHPWKKRLSLGGFRKVLLLLFWSRPVE